MEFADRYEVLLGSDTARGGMYLELWGRPRTHLLLCAFYVDADGSFEFERHRTDLAPEVEAWFQDQARRRLTPIADAEPGAAPDTAR